MSLLLKLHHFLATTARPADAAKEALAFSFVPKSTIDRAEEGARVVISGRAKCIETVISPFSKRSCAAYYVCAERKVGTSRIWRRVHEESDSRDFWVVGDSGAQALVEGAALTPYFTFDASGHTGPFLNDTITKEYLLERGIKVRGFVFDRSMRVLEGIVEEGEPVDVLAVAKWEADPEGSWSTDGYREREVSQRLRLIGKAGEPVFVRDSASWATLESDWRENLEASANAREPEQGKSVEQVEQSELENYEAELREKIRRELFEDEPVPKNWEEHVTSRVKAQLMEEAMEAFMLGDKKRTRVFAEHLRKYHDDGVFDAFLAILDA